MTKAPSVRVANPLSDAAQCAAIYAQYVRYSTATFEYDPPDVAEMSSRITTAQTTHEWLVADSADGVAGFAYAGVWNPRPAYAWSCETTIYLHSGAVGGGIGTALYQELLDRLRARGFHQAIGRIALPNEPSVRLHESFGFVPVGVHRALGYKLGQWVDVMHTSCQLMPATSEPEPLRPLAD
jgi:phosphinothricin acetyltransferase